MPPNYLDPAAAARQTAGNIQNTFNAQRRDGVVGPSSGRPDWAADTGGGAMRAGMFGHEAMPGRASTMPAMPAQGGAPMRPPEPLTPIATPAPPPGGGGVPNDVRFNMKPTVPAAPTPVAVGPGPGPAIGGPSNVGFLQPPSQPSAPAQAGGIMRPL